MVTDIRVIGLWSWPKNNHIPTAIDQFSMISFSEKWLSKILQNKIFFPHIKILKKIFEIFFRKIFFENFFHHFFFEFLEENDFWKPFFRKFNHQKLIHVSWDMIEIFFEIAISPRSDIRSFRSKFLVRDFDECYHLKTLNIDFW